MQNYLRGAAVMTMSVQDSYTSVQFPSLLVPLRRHYHAFIAARQKQAETRLTRYMREMPDDVLLRLGVSVAELERLRRLKSRAWWV
jgi:hypothetical protein